MKAVLHVNELARWRIVVANAGNIVAHCRAEGLAYDLEILANGEAVILLTSRFLAGSGMDRDLKRLAADGVTIAACHNALKGFEIDPSELASCVTVVPAGVVELILKQEKGYAYIRP